MILFSSTRSTTNRWIEWRIFLSCFVKPSVVAKCMKGKYILHLDLSEKNILPKKLLVIGFKAKKLADKLGYWNAIMVEFLDCVMEAFVDCGLYLQKKVPLENDTLKAFNITDPKMITSPNEMVLTRLLSLPSSVPSVLNNDDEECFNKEIKAVMVESNLPSATYMVNDKEQDVVWSGGNRWNIFQNGLWNSAHFSWS